MIRLCGTAMSRANRCLWTLEELGVNYEHVPTSFTGESRSAEYLIINPNGHVP
jgi:glutathione S-transferase